ncbi:AAA family ATPase [Butyrivibrio sp. NC2002]|uniref:AAA family ATPase n=1 Tax=Butyrivibrio sp. NC2002 TaxID=1410610 RepID=UPI000569B20A|nr:AAA family ATPase [Butyrivibrio sp. NC2002]
MKDIFEEIVGYEDIKSELRIISDMLNNPDVYKEMGVSINNGLILIGEPGTGKTTMANCLMKSTNRNAYVCRKKASDGEFVKHIVETFEIAKSNAPSIVLLDDLDKFSNEDEDHNDAEEYVTVQSCIDEIRAADVFVIATVNNARKIPRSLLRPGRIGKKIKVHMPQHNEAEAIVKHYLEKSDRCKNLDAVSIARMLSDESCATLENVIECAAMKAAYSRQERVEMKNIIDACLDLVFEAPECAGHLSEYTLRKTAYHEAGHAIAAEILDPGSVRIVSIRETEEGDYGLVRYFRPRENYDNAEYYENTIKISLAGKAATEIIFGETDMGANTDLHNAFDKAKYMVDNQCMYGFQNWIEDNHAEYVAENRNHAISMVMERNYIEVKKLLVEHRELLDGLAEALLQNVTLVYSDVQKICSSNI